MVGTAGAEETGTAGAEEGTETGETPEEIETGAAGTLVERAGQLVTLAAQEVMVSTSTLVTVIWATEAPAKRARAATEKRILMVFWLVCWVEKTSVNKGGGEKSWWVAERAWVVGL